MRKILLVMIAIFAMGGMCKAEEKNYWVTGNSYYDWYFGGNGDFNINAPEQRCYPVTIDFEGDKAYITGLVKLSPRYDTWPNWTIHKIEGAYDAAKGTITINTPVIDEKGKPNPNNYTVVEEGVAFGGNTYIVLAAGDYDKEPNPDGTYTRFSEDKLVFNVDENKQTLTSQTSFGGIIYSYDSKNNIGKASRDGFEYFKSATITKTVEGAKLAVGAATINYTQSDAMVGMQTAGGITLSNLGNQKTSYTIATSDDQLKVYLIDQREQTEAGDNLEIDGKEAKAYKLLFTPKQKGEYTGTVTFTATNGEKTTVTIKADVAAGIDFSSVIKEGSENIIFSNGDGSKFEINNDITGFPVVASTNEGDNTQSEMYATITVPEGQKGIFSWKGVTTCMQPNGLIITDGDKEIFSNWEKISGEPLDDDVTNIIRLDAGTHRILFRNKTLMDWSKADEASLREAYIDKPLRTYLYDFNFKLQPEMTFMAGEVKNDQANFGNLYVDKFAVNATTTIEILNTGMLPINVNNVEGTDNFSANIPEESAIGGDYLKVPITFTGENPYEYEGDVKLTIAGGNVITIHCKANLEELPVDYSPIVTTGTFSFDTSRKFPFAVNGNTAKSTVDGVTKSGVNKQSWLSASFDVPEGKKGTLSWEGTNSSNGLYSGPDGTQAFVDGTIIYIDGKEVKKFYGDMKAGSNQLDENDVTFASGRHTIKFYYQRKLSTAAGKDCFKISDLALALEDDATDISHINTDAANGVAEIFNVNGIRQNQVQKGLNIVKKNGKVTKMIVK